MISRTTLSNSVKLFFKTAKINRIVANPAPMSSAVWDSQLENRILLVSL